VHSRDGKTLPRAKSAGLNGAALLAVMKADASKLPAYLGVGLPGQGYALYRINKVVQPATPDKARLEAEQQQVGNALAQQEMAAYVEVLKQKAKAKIMKPVLAKAASANAEV